MIYAVEVDEVNCPEEYDDIFHRGILWQKDDNGYKSVVDIFEGDFDFVVEKADDYALEYDTVEIDKF